jgi:hypothetical protein
LGHIVFSTRAGTFVFTTAFTRAVGPTQAANNGHFPRRQSVRLLTATKAKVKNAWTFMSLPPYIFMVWEKFTLLGTFAAELQEVIKYTHRVTFLAFRQNLTSDLCEWLDNFSSAECKNTRISCTSPVIAV